MTDAAMQDQKDRITRRHGNADNSVSAILDDVRRNLPDGFVPLNIFNNRDLYEAELEKIFGNCWLFVAHESEIPNVDDFVLRYIGEDSWIISRQEDGQIKALFNSCIHRGTQICRADKGASKYFMCPYHGWRYASNGNLVGMPQRRVAYKGLDFSKNGLHRAPHVDTYRGLIFVNLDPNAMPLGDYLGGMRWYLDLHLGLGAGGMEVIGEPNRWRIQGDWKLGGDNFAGDSYHTQTLHGSIAEANLIPSGGTGTGGSFDLHITEIDGHSTSMRRTGPGTNTVFGYPEDLKRQFDMSGLKEDQKEIARGSLLHTGHVFPNFSFIHMPSLDSPGGEQATFLSIRQWQPKGAGAMEAWSWTLVPKNASSDYKRRAVKNAVANFSPSGNFEQDDTIVWSSISRAASSILARRGLTHLNVQMGMEGISEAAITPDWPGPGIAWNTNLEEGVQRTYYHHWLRRMS